MKIKDTRSDTTFDFEAYVIIKDGDVWDVRLEPFDYMDDEDVYLISLTTRKEVKLW